MSLGLLGDGFDLHTGGLDLAFPHHENERAQAIAAGYAFSRRWAHNGMIVDERGDKMSKSLGNTLSLLELLDVYDPRALRLQILQAHYRSPVSIGESTLRDKSAALDRLDTFAREFSEARGAEPDPAAIARFRERMDDDLNTPGAIAVGFELVTEARAASGEKARALAAAVFEIFEEALGLELQRPAG